MQNDTNTKGAGYAAQAIQLVASSTKRLAARKAIASAATGPHGNYTPEAKAMWAEYLSSGCPVA